MKIGGNTDAVIQIKTIVQNDIGEDAETWVDAVDTFIGWLDLSSGSSNGVNYNAKIQQSTHIFVCDYFDLTATKGGTGKKLTPENSRMIINGEVYEVSVYDNPMNMNAQLEIYLVYVGG